MELLKTTACYAIDDNQKNLRELATKVWTYAEPGGREIKTSAALCKFLKEKEFVVTQFRGMKTSFKAEWGDHEYGGAKRPNIGFLCRYDANHKYGHIKGNNLVVEVTIGAALGLQQAIRAASSKIGKVTVIGCPNSAQHWLIYLLNWKLFKDIDIVLCAVPGPQTIWNPIYLGAKTFRSRYKCGEIKTKKGHHIPAPETVTAGIFAINNVLTVQEHFSKGWKAKGILSDGGKNPRQIPLQSEAIVRISGQSNVDMALLERRVVPCLQAAATSTRCQLDLEMASKTIYSMINNTILGYCLQLNAYYCGVLSTPLKNSNIILNPVDMGNLSYFLPAIRPMFYIGTDDKVGTVAFRNAAISENAHRYSIAMAKALAMTAIDVMISPGTLLSIKEEHRVSVRKVKEVKFEPFAISKIADFNKPQIQFPLPHDSNTGWSKMS